MRPQLVRNISMKKQLKLIALFLLLSVATQAQYRFLQGIGIFIGETS